MLQRFSVDGSVAFRRRAKVRHLHNTALSISFQLKLPLNVTKSTAVIILFGLTTFIPYIFPIKTLSTLILDKHESISASYILHIVFRKSVRPEIFFRASRYL